MFLDTKSWKRGEEAGDLSEIQAAVKCIDSRFRQSLETKHVDLANLQELEESATYAQKYLNCESES